MTKPFKRTLMGEYLRYAFKGPGTLSLVILFNLTLIVSCISMVLDKSMSALAAAIFYVWLVLVFALWQWLKFKAYKKFGE